MHHNTFRSQVTLNLGVHASYRETKKMTKKGMGQWLVAYFKELLVKRKFTTV